VPSMDLQTGRDFALSLDPHRPWALPRGPAPDAFRPCTPDQPSADWMPRLRRANAPGEQNVSSSGSQKRKATKRIAVNCTPEQYAEIVAKTSAAGLSPSAVCLNVLLDTPLPARRRPVKDEALLAKVLAELGKIGSNINQIAYRYNIAEVLPAGNIEGALEAALRELLEWRTAIMQSLGYERPRKPPKKD